jgi:threonine synthase
MTAPASTIRCSGCGYRSADNDPYPFRCPQAGTDDIDHVMTRVLGPGAVFPGGSEENPFVRYRALMHSCHVAHAQQIPDAAYCRLVASLDASVAAVDGHGFTVTPFFRSAELSAALGFAPGGGVWVKNETGNVSGSHKGRHLMGVLIHLTVMEESGILDRRNRRDLAIASCGNAALAAAVIARAGGWPLIAFVPPDADHHIVRRLRELGTRVVVCRREPGVPGDATYLRLREELACGALPFTIQGNENGLTIEGGQTLGYELATDLAKLPAGLDHLIVQVGAGALASACIQALREAADLGALARLPRVHTVQTFGAHPLERAYGRVRALLPDEPGEAEVQRAVAKAAAQRSAFMQPWEKAPKSVATGILDDETYDWRAVVEGMLVTGGRPLVVTEGSLLDAHRLASSATGINVDATGAAGLAGLLEMRRSGAIGANDHAAVLFTGIQR